MIHAAILGVAMAIMLGLALARPMVGLLAFDWISFMNPQQIAYGIGSNMPWALLAALATGVGCLVAGEPKRPPINPTTVLIILFLVLLSVSTAVALTPAWMAYPAYIRVLKSFGFMILACGLLTSRKRIHALIWLMVLSVGYFGVRGGLFVLLTGGGGHVLGPPNTYISDNNQLAVALLVTLPLMNFLRAQSPHRIIRLGLLIAMGLTLLAVIGTYSRGGLLALFAMTAFLWWKSKAKLVTAVALVLGLGIAVSVMPPKWTHRMYSIQHYQRDTTAQQRLHVWRRAIGLAMARPLVGAGINGTETASVIHRFYPSSGPLAAHSIWFEVLGDVGFPALFVWIAIQVVAVMNARALRRYARDDPDLRWCDDLGRMAEVSIIAFLVGGSFLSLSYYDFYFMLVIVLAAARVVALQTIRQTQHEILTTGTRTGLPAWRQIGSRPGVAR